MHGKTLKLNKEFVTVSNRTCLFTNAFLEFCRITFYFMVFFMMIQLYKAEKL